MTAEGGTATEQDNRATGEAVLEVRGLSVDFPTDDGDVHAVRDVSFELTGGETVAIVGESGCGKSVTSLAIIGLAGRGAEVAGSARFRGEELIGRPERELSSLRGEKIAMIFQDPANSLNPVHPVGTQIAEAIRAHHDVSTHDARERAAHLLNVTGVPTPWQRLASYPHELSGGMRQRAVIAIAIANDPDVIIADEPTTALDVTVQAQVLGALQAAKDETGAAMVLITHDLGVVAGHAERVAVMYAGRIVETGTVDEIFYEPRMPYTLGLLGSIPRLDRSTSEPLAPIEGSPPSLINIPPGCPFTPRCPMARQRCAEQEPSLRATTSHGHLAACHFSDRLDSLQPSELFDAPPVDEQALTAVTPSGRNSPTTATDAPPPGGERPVLAVRNLVKHFPLRRAGVVRRRRGEVHAVCGVSFDLHPGETLALVGESGCGKTTTARALLGLLPATSGEVLYGGTDLTTVPRPRMRDLREELQIVFQDPYASLDPRMPVNEIIAEPLRIHRRYGADGPERVRRLMRLVGLKPEHRNRYPHEFSGGQRQRIGVARALALQPTVVVLDEPVSALDMSTQAGVINLLEALRDRLDLAYVFVAHDLSVVRHTADRVAIMYLGHIVEYGPTHQLFENPAHPYTHTLVSAIPLPDPRKERTRERIRVTGDVPSPADPPSGCRFRTRCPKFAEELSASQQRTCIDEVPPLIDHGQGHPVACHYAEGKQLL